MMFGAGGGGSGAVVEVDAEVVVGREVVDRPRGGSGGGCPPLEAVGWTSIGSLLVLEALLLRVTDEVEVL